jgi:hypothetical protein
MLSTDARNARRMSALIVASGGIVLLGKVGRRPDFPARRSC